jgi:hypothetical protein
MISYVLQQVSICVKIILIPVVLSSIVLIVIGSIIVGLAVLIVYQIDRLVEEVT